MRRMKTRTAACNDRRGTQPDVSVRPHWQMDSTETSKPPKEVWSWTNVSNLDF